MTSDDPRGDERSIGERPGFNQNVLGASFQDGPRQTPASTRSLLWGTVPVLFVIAAVVIFLSTR